MLKLHKISLADMPESPMFDAQIAVHGPDTHRHSRALRNPMHTTWPPCQTQDGKRWHEQPTSETCNLRAGRRMNHTNHALGRLVQGQARTAPQGYKLAKHVHCSESQKEAPSLCIGVSWRRTCSPRLHAAYSRKLPGRLRTSVQQPLTVCLSEPVQRHADP